MTDHHPSPVRGTTDRRSLARRLALAALAGTAVAGLGLAGSAMAQAARLIVALDPPTTETGRFWHTDGATGVLPSHEMLIGNDIETGAYDTTSLAARWSHNDDFTVWTVELRPEAEFHFDWGPVTAADVVHSYELHTADDSTLTGVGQLRGATLDIVDDHTVTFTFDEPRIGFLFSHAGRGSMMIYSKAQYEAEGPEGYDQRPAGTGHYQVVERRTATFDPEAREAIAQEAFTYLFEQYSDIPLASIHAEVVVDPDIVGGWDFPGVTSAGVSHWQLIRPAE